MLLRKFFIVTVLLLAAIIYGATGHAGSTLVIPSVVSTAKPTPKPTVKPTPTPRPTPTPIAMGWAFDLYPPQGFGNEFSAGSWWDKASCQDMFGSCIGHTTITCHTCTNQSCIDANCKRLGPGFCYPRNWPYDPKDSNSTLTMTPASDQSCHRVPMVRPGNYFVWYGKDTTGPYTTGLKACGINHSNYAKYAAVAKANPDQYMIGFYYNAACPGWPCFNVTGHSSACN